MKKSSSKSESKFPTLKEVLNMLDQNKQMEFLNFCLLKRFHSFIHPFIHSSGWVNETSFHDESLLRLFTLRSLSFLIFCVVSFFESNRLKSVGLLDFSSSRRHLLG